MVKFTFDKSFFYVLSGLLAVLVVGGIGWFVSRGGSQVATSPVAPAAQPSVPDTNIPAPVDAGGATGAEAPINVAPPPAPVADGSLDSILAGGEITPEQDALVSRLGPADALEKVQSPDTVWVDTRTAEEFATSHIPGAISIPAYSQDAALAELPKDKEIILYCA